MRRLYNFLKERRLLEMSRRDPQRSSSSRNSCLNQRILTLEYNLGEEERDFPSSRYQYIMHLKGFVSHDIVQLKIFLAGVRRGVSYLTLPAFLLKSLPSVQTEKQARDQHSVLTERNYYWNLVAL
jgi:hypothetical protein